MSRKWFDRRRETGGGRQGGILVADLGLLGVNYPEWRPRTKIPVEEPRESNPSTEWRSINWPQEPISIDQVTEGGQADQFGIKLGDTIAKINDCDTTSMSLPEAHKAIQAAGNTVQLSVKKLVSVWIDCLLHDFAEH